MLCELLFCPGCEKTAPAPVNEPDIVTATKSSDRGKKTQAESTPSPFWFIEIAGESGLDFTYYGNPSPQHYMVEQNGGGVALFDFDGDPRLDIFLANGSHFDQPAEKAGKFHQLYRATSLQQDAPKYENVTTVAGLEESGFGMGVACGDYNNDGFVDLYLCT